MPLRKGLDSILLLLTGAFLATNFFALGVLRQETSQPAHWLHLLVWICCAIAGQFWLERHLPQRDKLLFPLVMLPAGWGLLLIDRLLPAFADRQTLWLPSGLIVALLLAAWRPLLQLPQMQSRLTLALITLLLIAASILEGESAGLSGELLKLLLVIHFCVWLASRPQEVAILAWLARQGWRVLLWFLPLLLLVWQRDPGTALVTGLVLLLLLNLSGRSLRLLQVSTLLLVASAALAWLLLDVVQERVSIWLDPWSLADGRGYQIVQGLIALAEGGVVGAGVGQGQAVVVPVVHSDFVLVALAEEWGLAGVLVLLASMAVFTLRGLRIAWQLRDNSFLSLLAAGMTLLPGIQGLLICGGVLRLFPLTGVTLPFLGYGGSALLTSLLSASLLVRLSAEVSHGPP
ncbi:MAG: FtsW/RodA/SpoVE family cell cycle protein [Anaerolineaceae bacterium]|nr:FtsW/RodA/SpoVE family cell cycle protein [Anaerolineaceae bacterium]